MALPGIETRFAFFTGKGGVGKTSLACASTLRLAEQGRRVLLVSTDPASNLDEVLETPLTTTPTEVHGVPGLSALNVDPEAAAAAYRERMVGPYRGILPPAAIRSMEEQFSGGCTVEIAAFDAFAGLLAGNEVTQAFDHVVFDTAPTGHTLRLLSLPSAWNDFLATNTTGSSCLGPLAGLEKSKATYAAAVRSLADRQLTTVVLVARPEVSALREADRTRHELADLGVRNQVLALNGLYEAASDDSVARAMSSRHAKAVKQMPAGLAALPRSQTGFIPRGLVGLASLRAFLHPQSEDRTTPAVSSIDRLPDGLATIVDDIEAAGHGLVMTMGKGGVGKTTVAAAVAVALAERGRRVVLSTTDPAAHVSWALDEQVPNLTVERIDPVAEVERYRNEVMGKAGASLDAQARAMLDEDLRSPCTEEIAVFRAFAQSVDKAQDAFVVLDTAPTGHTILLMDSAEAYHREVSRTQGDSPESVRKLLPRLRDPFFTRVLIVTLAEATPVHEAERLQADLHRAGIEPFAWVINQSLLASGTHDPVLTQRGAYEAPFIAHVMQIAAKRCALIPWQVEAPVGELALSSLATQVPNDLRRES
ncbi:arsenical pump-driving ATPase [Ideonella sp. 4Y11]|uniref:Arsenical pump-driving ATPase n=2 Tax=Sphaerotilaceae TaxID=2975441 RepID=A0A940YFE8_9BURK|nr:MULTISPECIES: arsenical pump-driving ATPase [Sphaerotilaceae]MBQ0957752.1 arsenical pump-driving ATPase [Ideonella aquatica]URI12028.1 arsenical pump-driving ATPase [Aquincola tertiaricarbonis]